MQTVNPTREQGEAFARSAPDDKAIVMVNLLRFRERADYGEPGGGAVSGRKAYDRYSKAVLPMLWEVGGQILWMGKVRTSLILPDGEAWDEVLLVHYPSRAAFLRMVQSAPYQAIMKHRTAALLDARLIEARTEALPRWMLAVARGATRLKALVIPGIPR